MVSFPGYSYKPILSMVCLKHCTFKMKNGFKSTRHPIKQNRKKWIIVSIYLDAGTLEKPEFNWRSDLPVYFGVEKTLGVFSGSLDVVVLFIFVQRILEYFIPFTSITNSRTVFICYLWQKTRWFRKKLDSVRQELALLQLLLWYSMPSLEQIENSCKDEKPLHPCPLSCLFIHTWS